MPVEGAVGSSSAGGGVFRSTDGTPRTRASFSLSLGSGIESPPNDQKSKPPTSTEWFGRSAIEPGPNVVTTWLCRISPSGFQKFPVQILHPLLALLALAAAGPRNLHYPQLHTPRAVSQLRPCLVRRFRNPLHQPRQHADAIPQQAAIGRVVDVGLHYRSSYIMRMISRL